jgi:hypothetical protein
METPPSTKSKRMKSKLLYALMAVMLLLFPTKIVAQAPTLGTANDFVLFTTIGAVSNTGISQLTGNVGTNNGSITGFGNVNGRMHNADGGSAQAGADMLLAYNQLKNAIPAFFPAPLLGNGDTLIAGVYSISAATTLSNTLTLDAKGNSNAVFIFQIEAPFSSLVNSKVDLINGALACNVYWKIEGLVSIASGTSMKGTIIANNAAIAINAGSTLEGRALSTAGAISVDGVLGFTPVGCGSTYLTGPTQPNLGSTICYALFSANGALANAGISKIKGDVGTNVGLTLGFEALDVIGAIHPIPDGSTTACASDLLNAYTYLNLLPYDIELLYPEQLGRNLVLTPHTYFMNGAATLTDTLYLNAQGNVNAVFVIQIKGALLTSTHAKVLLINGTQAKNVFWKVEGAVAINDYSMLAGTIIANNGAVNLSTGVNIDGRVMTTNGALSTASVNVTMTPGCIPTSLSTLTSNEVIDFAPNPFDTFTSIHIENAALNETYELTIYNLLAQKVLITSLTSENTLLQTGQLAPGMYTYQIQKNHTTIQTGKLISNKNN